MGCSYSRIERQEMVLRCKARKYIKEFVKARQAFSVAHNMYLRSLRTIGSVLLQFATDETNLHSHQNTNTHHHLPLLPPFMPSPPPLSPMSTTSETTTTSSFAIHRPPPLPPLTPPSSSGWDFWDPFHAVCNFGRFNSQNNMRTKIGLGWGGVGWGGFLNIRELSLTKEYPIKPFK
ncbi:hypothetical protein Fot_23028 [Forsythia ovata]|uniref:DUF630 domain-containing protein n=1 Tax=Forsythia ovata TaxID=205694 RepID=A0ABD1UZE3_9LAMI